MTVVLAATEGGVARVAPSGGSWALERALGGRDVRCLAADGATVFAGTADDGVMRSDDGGATWARAGLEGERVRSLAARDGAVCAGTREPRVHASTDGGATWRALSRFPRWRSWWWVQPAERPFRPSYVSALAITDRGTIIAGIEACAVLRSDDGGRTWSRHRRGALRDCHELHAVRGRVYEAGAGGAAVSDDDGRTWRRPRAGLGRRYGWSLAVAGETAFLAGAPYRSAHSADARSQVHRSRRDGRWERCTERFASLPRLGAAAGGEVFAALGDGTLLRSGDEGAAWERLDANLGGPARALLCLPH